MPRSSAQAAKIFRIFEEELDINVSVLKLFKMTFAVLFICHIMGCAVYGIATGVQEEYVYGMFRPQEWWGCELRPWAPDDYGVPVVTNASNFKPDPPVEYELLTGQPRAPVGFCDEGRWINKMEKGWIYLWVLYWTVTTMTTIGYGDFSPLTPIEVGCTIVVQVIRDAHGRCAHARTAAKSLVHSATRARHIARAYRTDVLVSFACWFACWMCG